MNQPRNIAIIGAGHAGVQAAASLRDEGFDGVIHLIDAQSILPYQRPPLSKAFLKGEVGSANIVLRSEAFYTERRIELHLGRKVDRIERQDCRVVLEGGQQVDYDRLIIATGARARPLAIGGQDIANVFVLRDMQDADAIRRMVSPDRRIVVIGAGFIGLEFAAAARSLGAHVTVIEAQPRVMARAVSVPVSATFAALHQDMGTDIRLKTGVAALHGSNGKVDSIETDDGQHLPADAVVVGIGVLAKDRLATEAGLTVSNGVVVNAHLCTSDSNIFAVGDNTYHPNPFFGGMMRLESVQNAVDQAKCAARILTGKPEFYHAIPWFWSDQASLKLQIAGVSQRITQQVVRGDPASNAYSIFGFDGSQLKVVESINRPADHMIARRLIAKGATISPDQAADPDTDLKAIAGGDSR